MSMMWHPHSQAAAAFGKTRHPSSADWIIINFLSAFALSDSQAKNFHVSLFSFSPQRSNAILKTFFRVTRNHLMQR
jgi:hypothetical protein